jgi:hypothetical protein
MFIFAFLVWYICLLVLMVVPIYDEGSKKSLKSIMTSFKQKEDKAILINDDFAYEVNKEARKLFCLSRNISILDKS